MNRDVVMDLFFKNKYKVIQRRDHDAVLYKIYKKEKVFLMRYDTIVHEIIKLVTFDNDNIPYLIKNMDMLYIAI